MRTVCALIIDGKIDTIRSATDALVDDRYVTIQADPEILNSFTHYEELSVSNGVLIRNEFDASTLPASWVEIKAVRESIKYMPIEVNSCLYDCNPESKINFEQSIEHFDDLATNGYVTWKLHDNTFKKLSKDELVSVYAEVKRLSTIRYSLAFNRAEELNNSGISRSAVWNLDNWNLP